MDVMAKLSSKGQVTVPKAVRDALELREGDQVVFRVEGKRAALGRTPDLLDLGRRGLGAGREAGRAMERGASRTRTRRSQATR
jgi:antitoxin PrlF